MPQNHFKDRAGLCAERETDAEFARPFGDTSRQHTVNANDREHERDEAERFEQNQREPALGGCGGKQLLHGCDADDRLIFVHCPDRAPDGRGQRRNIALSADNKRHRIVREVPLHLGAINGIRFALRQRGLPHVSDDTDNGERRLVGRTDVNPPTDRVLIGEHTLGQ